jgi:hypothetical protein
MYHVKISNRLTALENLDINRVWENITWNTKPLDEDSPELKQHKPRFDKECSTM